MMLWLLLLQGSSAARALVALDRRIHAAMVANDRATLRRSIASDFRFTHADGTVETKADILRTAALSPPYYLRREVLRATAHMRGRTARVVGSLDVASGALPDDPPPPAGPICYALTYVHTYVNRNGRWQLLDHRTTELTRPERPCAPAR